MGLSESLRSKKKTRDGFFVVGNCLCVGEKKKSVMKLGFGSGFLIGEKKKSVRFDWILDFD